MKVLYWEQPLEDSIDVFHTIFDDTNLTASPGATRDSYSISRRGSFAAIEVSLQDHAVGTLVCYSVALPNSLLAGLAALLVASFTGILYPFFSVNSPLEAFLVRPSLIAFLGCLASLLLLPPFVADSKMSTSTFLTQMKAHGAKPTSPAYASGLGRMPVVVFTILAIELILLFLHYKAYTLLAALLIYIAPGTIFEFSGLLHRGALDDWRALLLGYLFRWHSFLFGLLSLPFLLLHLYVALPPMTESAAESADLQDLLSAHSPSTFSDLYKGLCSTPQPDANVATPLFWLTISDPRSLILVLWILFSYSLGTARVLDDMVKQIKSWEKTTTTIGGQFPHFPSLPIDEKNASVFSWRFAILITPALLIVGCETLISLGLSWLLLLGPPETISGDFLGSTHTAVQLTTWVDDKYSGFNFFYLFPVVILAGQFLIAWSQHALRTLRHLALILPFKRHETQTIKSALQNLPVRIHPLRFRVIETKLALCHMVPSLVLPPVLEISSSLMLWLSAKELTGVLSHEYGHYKHMRQLALARYLSFVVLQLPIPIYTVFFRYSILESEADRFAIHCGQHEALIEALESIRANNISAHFLASGDQTSRFQNFLESHIRSHSILSKFSPTLLAYAHLPLATRLRQLKTGVSPPPENSKATPSP